MLRGLVHTLLLCRPSLAQVSFSALRYRTPLGFSLNMTDHLRKKNQLDALFILSLFCQSTSTCFGSICSPSSGGTLYVYKNWYVFCFSIDCLLAWFDLNQANRQSIEKHNTYQLYIYSHPNQANRHSTKKHNTYQLLYTYSIPPDDGLQICPKHVEVDRRKKLRINSAASWFLLHRYIEMHGQQNIKK